MKFNKSAFFDEYRRRFGRVRPEQVVPIERLIDFIEADRHITDIRHAAYMLATVYGECGDTFEPVEEGFYLGSRAARFRSRLRYAPWWGRGYVQLTWLRNYRLVVKELGIAVTEHPELAMVPENAYAIMSWGMRGGKFTGRSLSDYISGRRCDYRNARRIINGTDKARKFAGWAKRFEFVLKKSIIAE